jgi:hypothetical protein
MAYDLPFLDHSTQRRLSRQVSGLARDAGHITDLLARFTANARREAQHYGHDFADEAWHQGAVAAKAIGKQAVRAGRAVGRDPVPAVVAVAGLACLLTLVMASGRSPRRRR